MAIDVGEWLTETVPWRFGSATADSGDPDDSSWIGRRREEVLTLVRERGGYTWEDEIACELGWSPSTMTWTLTEMEAADLIQRYQIGPRSVVCVPETASDRAQHTHRTIPGP